MQKLDGNEWRQRPLDEPIFHDDERARDFLERLRWPQGPVCPGCSNPRVRRLLGRTTRKGLMKCLECRAQFTVSVGTEIHKSHIGLSKWCRAAQLLAVHEGSLPILRLARELDVSYTTARRMAGAIGRTQRADSDAMGKG